MISTKIGCLELVCERLIFSVLRVRITGCNPLVGLMLANVSSEGSLL